MKQDMWHHRALEYDAEQVEQLERILKRVKAGVQEFLYFATRGTPEALQQADLFTRAIPDGLEIIEESGGYKVTLWFSHWEPDID